MYAGHKVLMVVCLHFTDCWWSTRDFWSAAQASPNLLIKYYLYNIHYLYFYIIIHKFNKYLGLVTPPGGWWSPIQAPDWATYYWNVIMILYLNVIKYYLYNINLNNQKTVWNNYDLFHKNDDLTLIRQAQEHNCRF